MSLVWNIVSLAILFALGCSFKMVRQMTSALTDEGMVCNKGLMNFHFGAFIMASLISILQYTVAATNYAID